MVSKKQQALGNVDSQIASVKAQLESLESLRNIISGNTTVNMVSASPVSVNNLLPVSHKVNIPIPNLPNLPVISNKLETPWGTVAKKAKKFSKKVEVNEVDEVEKKTRGRKTYEYYFTVLNSSLQTARETRKPKVLQDAILALPKKTGSRTLAKWAETLDSSAVKYLDKYRVN